MSLHGEYDDNNLFAKILRREIPAVLVYADEHVIAFMDIFPQSRGHMLVIPRGVKARNFIDLPSDKVGPLMERVQLLTKAAVKALKPDGVTITQFNGAPAGQTIFHLHWHIIPRFEGVRMAGHANPTKSDIPALQELAKQIAAAIEV